MKKNVQEFGTSIDMNSRVRNSREIICQEALGMACELKACFITMWHGYNAYTLFLIDIVLS